MKKIFLASYLAGTITQLANFIHQNHINSNNILFIPTAGNVEEYTGYIDKSKAALTRLGYKLDLLDIAQVDGEQCQQAFMTADIICICGGNTFYLLQELNRKNLHQLLVKKIADGCIYIGESAGAIILAPDVGYIKMMDDRTLAPELKNDTGLNSVDFYPLPHYIEEPFVDAVQQIYDEYQNSLKLIPISNQQAIIVNDSGYCIV